MEVINRSQNILKDLEKNHIYNGNAINRNSLVAENTIMEKAYEADSISRELEKMQQDNLKNELDSLKIENEKLSKSNKKLKKEYEKINLQLESSKHVDEVAITMDQISFETTDSFNVIDELSNLDILTMTPLDAMNALFTLQRKVKK